MMSFIVKLLKKKVLVGRRRAMVAKIRGSLREWTFSIVKRNFGFKIVTSKELLNDSDKYFVLPFGSEELVVLGEPSHSSDELPNFIRGNSTVKTLTFSKPFVSEVENAELVGSTAVGFDREGNLISETINLANLARSLPTRTLILKNLPTWRSPQQDTACSIVSGHSNYYHWITECLPRLEGLEYYQAKTGRKPALIIDANPSKWQIESLRLLGYEPNDCIRWHGPRLKVKRLVVPSWRRKYRIIPPTTCRWLRQRMLSNLPALRNEELPFSPRIYISRSKTAGRQITNEEDVLKTLIPLGFVAYTLENMNFADQVRLFSQAEIVVAAHGAGLVNIIFAQNLKVIEFFGSFGSASYFLIAQAMGFRYGCLWLSNEEKNNNEKYSDITVDIAKLQSLVTEMLDISDDSNLGSDRKSVSTVY
jgi:hypothetical protein